MDKKHCIGCQDNFYNGNNPYNVKECWSFKTAELTMKKKVPIDQTPPWNQPPIEVPKCYRQRGYVFVEKDRTC